MLTSCRTVWEFRKLMENGKIRIPRLNHMENAQETLVVL